MKTIAQKTSQPTRTQAAADATVQHKHNSEGTFQFENKRPAVAVQKALQALMNKSAAVRQRATPALQYQQSPVQMKNVEKKAIQMKAGVDSFNVRWSKNTGSNATYAALRLDYTARFKQDHEHRPEDADFRQNAGHKMKITGGTHKGEAEVVSLSDDDYSRRDDTAGHDYSDVDFVSNDNPGSGDFPLAADDVLDYSFTAEQMIIDTSDSDKVIAKRGPHTATITGAHPRTWAAVGKTLPFNADTTV